MKKLLLLLFLSTFFGQAEDLSTLKRVPLGRMVDFSNTITFATNRKPIGKGFPFLDPIQPIDDKIHIGTAYVFYPGSSHTRGHLETEEKIQNAKKAFSIQSLEFETNTRTSICPTEGTEGQKLLVYVHGYNNSFESALLQATQIYNDFRWQGKMMALVWPSHGELLRYLDDKDNADRSVQQFVPLLEEIRRCWQGRVSFVVHSMGNRLFLKSLQQLKEESTVEELIDALGGCNADIGFQMDRLILAAPDVSIEEFRTFAPKATRLFKKVVHYYSEKDTAVKLSSLIRATRGRAGTTFVPVLGVESISVDRVNDSDVGFGHSYFSASLPVLEDIEKLLYEPLENIKNPQTREAPISLLPDETGQAQRWAFD